MGVPGTPDVFGQKERFDVKTTTTTGHTLDNSYFNRLVCLQLIQETVYLLELIVRATDFGDCLLFLIVQTIDFGDCLLIGIVQTMDFGDHLLSGIVSITGFERCP